MHYMLLWEKEFLNIFFPLLFSTRHLCRPCHNREKAKGLGKYICQKCHLIIDEQPLMFKNDSYHPDHFNCTHCGYVVILKTLTKKRETQFSQQCSPSQGLNFAAFTLLSKQKLCKEKLK